MRVMKVEIQTEIFSGTMRISAFVNYIEKTEEKIAQELSNELIKLFRKYDDGEPNAKK